MSTVENSRHRKRLPGLQHAIGFAAAPDRSAARCGCRRRWCRRRSAVRKRQRLGVALDERDPLVEMPRRRALAADRQHVGIDVADGGMEIAAGGLGGAERDVAGAAGDVEQRERRIAARWIERVDHHVFPDPVQPRRHQIVHQVVALGDAVKHVVHQRLLVVQRHVLEAEMRGLVRPIHQLLLRYGRTIARPPQWRYHVSLTR